MQEAGSLLFWYPDWKLEESLIPDEKYIKSLSFIAYSKLSKEIQLSTDILRHRSTFLSY